MKIFLSILLFCCACAYSELPREQGYLRVSEKHELFFARYGNPEGIPVVVLHGGPGGGGYEKPLPFFDLSRFNVVMFDQRGASRSKPFACMEENTTQHSIADIETLRMHLGIHKWLVFGGSWGSLLGVLYGEAHPESCLGFILTGVFLGREQDIRLLQYTEKAKEHYQQFILNIPEDERAELIAACYKRVMDPDPEVHMKMARAVLRYHLISTTSSLNSAWIDSLLNDNQFTLGLTRTVLHYASHQLFLYPNQALAEVQKVSHLPAIIVQGNADINCLPEQAELLHQNWKNSQLWMIDGGGHNMDQSAISAALTRAANSFIKSMK